jgi:hypothetical protein
VNRGPFFWNAALSAWISHYASVISNRTEMEPIWVMFSNGRIVTVKQATLQTQNQMFTVIQGLSELLGLLALACFLFIISVLIIGLAFATVGAALPPLLAGLSALAGTLAEILGNSKIFSVILLVFVAWTMHMQTKGWVAPSVTREYSRGLDRLEQVISISPGTSFDKLNTEASVKGGQVTLSTGLTNTDSALAQPLVETYLYSVDGRIVEILSRQPALQTQSTETWRDTITLLPGRYTAVTAVHTSEEIGLASQVNSLEILSPAVGFGVSLDKTQVSLGQAIQATIVLTNASTTEETGDLVILAQFGNDEDFESWLVNLAPSGSKRLTYSFTPEALGGGRLRVSVTDGSSVLASRDTAYLVGNGAALAVNIAAQAIYSPSLAVTFPITAINVGNQPTSTLLSLVTLDNLRESVPVFTDTLTLNVGAATSVLTTATALRAPLSQPGSYTALFFLGGEVYQSLDFAVAAEDTLYASITPDDIFHDVGDTIPLTITVMNSAFTLADGSVEVAIWRPDGITQTVAMNQVGTGLYRGMITTPISGTYLATVEVNKPNHQVVGSDMILIADEMSQLQVTMEGHPVLATTRPVTFTVRNEQSIPIVGAWIVISGTIEYRSNPTDRLGQAVLQLSPISSDPYQITIEKPGFADTLIDLPVWIVPRVYLPVILRNH